MNALLTVTGLTAGYDGVPVLHDVDLRVPAGTICAILGANGAGKTTLMRVLAGILAPTSGTATIDGIPLDGTRNRRIIQRQLGHTDLATTST